MSLIVFRRFFLAAALTLAASAAAQWNGPAPVAVTKAEPRAAFRASAGEVSASVVALPPLDVAEIDAVRRANAQSTTKALQIGVTRDTSGRRQARAEALAWAFVDGAHVARWEVSSPGATALRIELVTAGLPEGAELRFAGSDDPGTVYGPFAAADEPTTWSPVLEGDLAIVEVSIPAGRPGIPASFGVSRVAHHFVGVRETDGAIRAKASGDSGSCNNDLVCFSAGDPGLANLAKSVARMSFVKDGFSYTCTGTLIQSTDGTSTPFFYSANHCFDNEQAPYKSPAEIQAVASTLTTHWFFDRTGCGTGITSGSYVQRTGGATLLYSNVASDVLLLQLNAAPPPGTWFAGWNAASIGAAEDVTAIHHPAGDWKKISFGKVDGFEVPTTPYGSMVRVSWSNGVTEGGSSGSGLFRLGLLRGGLWGGASYCGAPAAAMYDFYSRLDLAYTSIRQWIDPPGATARALTVTKAGSGDGSITSSPAGISCPGACTASFPNGFQVTLVATPSGASTFAGWSGACSGMQCTVTMDAARSVTATFNAPVVTLQVAKDGSGSGTVTSSPAGIDCGTTCTGTFPAGTSVTLTAAPAAGSTFLGWSGPCSGTSQCTVMLGATTIVRARFEPALALSVTKVGNGTVTSSQGGVDCGATCSVALGLGQVLTLNAAASAGSRFTGWSGACSGIQPCTLTMDAAKNVTATFATTTSAVLVDVSTGAIDFGGQSMGTTSPAVPIVVTNVGANAVTFGAITATAQFGQAGNCVNIAPGFSCTVNATFSPAVTGIALGQAAPASGQISIPTNAAGSPHVITVSGSAEKSLVSHYYRSILRRAPDAGGKAFWEAEAQRLVGLGIGVNEAWYAMAMQFYGSVEYANFNRGNAAYVTDLYNTFFNRIPDGAGLSYWNQELFNGLPRGVALAAFMFSPEFRNFSQGLFGSTSVRPEVDTVVDFYRGLLGRTPDSGGFAYWLQRFRAAQCTSQSAVVAEVEAISGAFANGAEYGARARTNAQFVGDLYNAFLRRGGDLAGVQYWIGQLSGARTRDQVRVEFRNSAEFQARVNAILAAPCIP